jgi:hypothetical protein
MSCSHDPGSTVAALGLLAADLAESRPFAGWLEGG